MVGPTETSPTMPSSTMDTIGSSGSITSARASRTAASSIRATVRAYRFVVSTSSAATIHLGREENVPLPGQRKNLFPPAARYSLVSVFVAMLASKPARRERWMEA